MRRKWRWVLLIFERTRGATISVGSDTEVEVEVLEGRGSTGGVLVVVATVAGEG